MYLYCFNFALKGDIYFKIGISSDVRSRLQTLQTGNPFKLSVLFKIKVFSREDAIVLERGMHNKLWEIRLEGEWFSFGNKYTKEDLSKELRILINKLMDQANISTSGLTKASTSIKISVKEVQASNPHLGKLDKWAKGKEFVVLTPKQAKKLNIII